MNFVSVKDSTISFLRKEYFFSILCMHVCKGMILCVTEYFIIAYISLY